MFELDASSIKKGGGGGYDQYNPRIEDDEMIYDK